jgi:diguanylate cyclase (GGDEF)-like protein
MPTSPPPRFRHAGKALALAGSVGLVGLGLVALNERVALSLMHEDARATAASLAQHMSFDALARGEMRLLAPLEAAPGGRVATLAGGIGILHWRSFDVVSGTIWSSNPAEVGAGWDFRNLALWDRVLRQLGGSAGPVVQLHDGSVHGAAQTPAWMHEDQREGLYAHALVPLRQEEKLIGVAELVLDLTAKRTLFHAAFLRLQLNSVGLMLLAVALPAWVLVRRTREKAAAEAQARHLAQHDPLTGLPNRTGFLERLERTIALGRRRGWRTGVLLIDLDRFKEVNDTLGHPAGDALLREVAARLSAAVRAEDTVVRLGGDEFAIVQAAVDQPQGAATLARRLQDAIAAPFDLFGHRAHVGCSIGIAFAPDDGTDPAVLLRLADIALYRAKEEGRGRARFYEAGMDAALLARRRLEQDLRQALDGGGFSLAYQPLFTLASGRLEGFEALLRWNHPERGPVPPAEFLPLAAETGLIAPLGAWVLRAACHEAARWPEPLSVSVNLAAAQFRHGDVAAVVRAALAESGLAPARLEVEVTETLLLQDPEAVFAKLEELRGLGIGIAMDDFGSGPSCLSWLWRFPFDRLKIDRDIVRDMQQDPRAAIIVQAILGLGRTLAVTIAAEGVETEAQAESLRLQGCEEAQGYLLGRPLDQRGVTALIAAAAAGQGIRCALGAAAE